MFSKYLVIFLKFILTACHLGFWFLVFVSLAVMVFIRKTWGYVDIAQILFFVQTDLDKIDKNIVFIAGISCIILPLILAVMLHLFWRNALKKRHKNKLLFLGYLDLCLLWVAWLILSISSTPCFKEETTDFYKQRYVHVDNLKQDRFRNVILIFGESLETKYAVDKKSGLTIQDTDAVKFNKLTEGYAQRWTQGALFSAFTGVHIHYLAEYIFFEMMKKVRWRYKSEKNVISVANQHGKNFDFELPNINFLGDIARQHGYQTLFVQGGSTRFSGTRSFLLKHGFSKEDVYGYEVFTESPNFEKAKEWWGIDDAAMFSLFKQKILALNKDKPFFAVAFTLDLHIGENPFYDTEDDIKKAVIISLNDFITWFKKQDFYDNTTLVIVGDHKRMQSGAQPGGKIYNAFFNLPDDLQNHLNTQRTFNQIDLFPSLLEIMGMQLPLHKAGLGTSIFAKQKTLAEEYTYDDQENIFLKKDDFYLKLWSKEKMFENQ